MDFEIEPKALLEVLKRLFPHRSRILAKGPLVTLRAAGEGLILEGQFDNAWSVPAVVHASGHCSVDLVALSKPLTLYKPREPLRFTVSDDGLKFGTTRLRLHNST